MPHTPYKSSSVRRAMRQKRRRNFRLFMFGSLFSLVLIMIMTFILGSNSDIFDINDYEEYSQISENSVVSSTASNINNSSSSSSADPLPSNGYTICVDPGHGFNDPGAPSTIYDDLMESDVNLAVALKLRDILVSRGFEVIMTHESNDTAVVSLLSLNERCYMANSNDVDLYISLHCNSYEDDVSVSGIRLYHYTHASESSIRYAEKLSESISAIFEKKCSVYSANYQVCREVSMPSVLIEMGFITNKGDCDLFKDTDWQKNMATGIADGIEDYCEVYLNR